MWSLLGRARGFVKVKASALVMDEIAFFNHQVNVCVKGRATDARFLFSSLLGQVEAIIVLIGGEIQI